MDYLVLKQEEINDLEVGDWFSVTAFELTLDSKVLTLVVDGAWFGDTPETLGEGSIVISHWSSVTGRWRIGTEHSWNTIDLAQPLRIEEISKLHYQKDYVFLGGYGGDTGVWIEYTLQDASVEARFAEAADDD
jgi:hypothetical protein